MLGLQGVELICIGYNTPVHYVPDPGEDRLAGFHNNLVMAVAPTRTARGWSASAKGRSGKKASRA